MNRLEALERLLEQIAVSCDTLANFAAYAAGSAGPGEPTYNMHAVQAMAERVGAMARLPLEEPAMNAARHLVGHDLGRALLDPDIAKPVDASPGDLRRGMQTATGCAELPPRAEAGRQQPAVAAADAPMRSGVEVATGLLHELLVADGQVELGEAQQSAADAGCITSAIDEAAAAADPAVWRDFTKAVGYVLRTSVGGAALPSGWNLSRLIVGLEAPDAAVSAAAAAASERQS